MSQPPSRPDPTDEPTAHPAEWLDAHGDALYRFARSKVARRVVAEDLVQETLLAALRASERYRGDAATRTWLLAILRRKVADYYRRERTASPTIEADLVDDRAGSSPFDAAGNWRHAPARWKDPQSALEADDFWRVFDGCSSRLPRRLAEAFRLREVEGLDVERVRATLDVGAGNLRIRLHRARLMLRECLERNWFDPKPLDLRRRP